MLHPMAHPSSTATTTTHDIDLSPHRIMLMYSQDAFVTASCRLPRYRRRVKMAGSPELSPDGMRFRNGGRSVRMRRKRMKRRRLAAAQNRWQGPESAGSCPRP